MFEPRKINSKKITTARGNRSRKEIVKNASNAFSEQDLYNWEKGLNLPRLEKIPYLTKGLGVSFEEISDEILLRIAA